MKNKIIASVLMLVAGILYLLAAPQYANAADKTADTSALDIVLIGPAYSFMVFGVFLTLAGVICVTSALIDQPPPANTEPIRKQPFSRI